MKKKCKDMCQDSEIECPIEDCRYWIKFEEDLNCSLVSIDKNGKMTLREVGDRLGVSFVRVKQLETQDQKKLLKRINNKTI